MRRAIEESNRRREKQVRFDMEHAMLPERAKRSGTGQSTLLANKSTEGVDLIAHRLTEDHYAVAADYSATYTTPPAQETTVETLEALIDKARQEMERAAKSLDFLAAARYRDRMYELQKLREEQLAHK